MKGKEKKSKEGKERKGNERKRVSICKQDRGR